MPEPLQLLAGSQVRCTDGRAVRHVHLVPHGRHQVTIPVDAVTAIDDNGVHIRLTKEELSAQRGPT